MILKLLKHFFNSERGLPLPHAYDPVLRQASFRLFCAYVSFVIASVSIVALHWVDTHVATWTAILFWCLAMVFYMLKRLSKASIDLDDRSISLDSGDDAGADSQKKTDE